MSTPPTDSMIHRAKVQYSNSATGEIQAIIPSVTSQTGTVPVTMWGREIHAANSKWLVPDVGDTIVVCREDEDYTNVFWLNTTVPPDPPYTFVDTPGVDGDKTTHFGTMLQVETGNLGQVRVNTSTNVAGAALVVQPWGTEGTGLYVNHSNNSTTNRASIMLGDSIQIGTGGTTSTLGDWYIVDVHADKYNLSHTGHSDTTTGGLIIRSTGLAERYLQLLPGYVDSNGAEWCAIFRDAGLTSIILNATLRPFSVIGYNDSIFDLGTAGIQWRDLYLVNNPIVSSDQNYKTDIVDSNLGLDFVNALRPVSFKFLDGGIRTHYGLIAQEVEAVLGADASDTAIWTKETIEASPEVPADEYLPGQPAVEEHVRQSLRYNELISPMIKAIQELTTRLTALESA